MHSGTGLRQLEYSVIDIYASKNNVHATGEDNPDTIAMFIATCLRRSVPISYTCSVNAGRPPASISRFELRCLLFYDGYLQTHLDHGNTEFMYDVEAGMANMGCFRKGGYTL